MRRALAYAAAVAMIATSGALAGPTAAFAASCGTVGHYFQGWAHPASLVYEGAAASITVRNSTLCTTNTNAAVNWSYAWVLISSRNGQAAAQAGYFHGYNQAIRHAVEDYRGTTDRRIFVGSNPTVGSTYRYMVQYADFCSCEQEIVGTTVYQSTNFNPKTVFTSPWIPEWAGETEYTASKLPGTSSARATFSSMDEQDPDDGFIGAAFPDATIAGTHPTGSHVSGFSGNSFSIWND